MLEVADDRLEEGCRALACGRRHANMEHIRPPPLRGQRIERILCFARGASAAPARGGARRRQARRTERAEQVAPPERWACEMLHRPLRDDAAPRAEAGDRLTRLRPPRFEA